MPLLRKDEGFTLVELMVTVAVFGVVSSVILYNYSQFNTNILITNYAYDVGLSIRKAQVYGVSVRQNVASSIQNDFSGSYGVHFDFTVTPVPASFVFFSDLPNGNPNHYDASTGEKLNEQFLPANYAFSNVCGVVGGSGVKECSRGTPPLTYLDISFVRPEPDAIIESSNPSSLTKGYYQSAFICLKSPLGKYRKIIVQSTGQISVSPLAADPDCTS